MLKFALRRLVVHLALFTLVFANIAPAAFGAARVFETKKPRSCPAGKVAKRAKKRVKVRVVVRSHGRVVGHRKVWRKRWIWSCASAKAVGAGPAADVTAPSAPTALAATVSDRKVVLLWNPSTDNVGVTAYRVYRDAVLAGTVTTTTTFSDSPLANGVAYKYLVVAVDGAGNASTPAAVSATAGGVKDTIPPSSPPNFIAAAGDRQVVLSWDASTDDTKVVFYQVFRDGIPIGAQEVRTLTDTGLVNGQTYTYTVIAHDTADNTSPASSASATPSDAQPPTVPAGLVATPGVGSVSLTWSAATDNVGVTAYNVFRSSGGSGYSLIASPTTPYYADLGLALGTAYSYKIGAADAAGNSSSQSAVATTTPLANGGSDATPPSTPGTPAVTAGTNQATLSWTASTDNVGVTGYKVFRSTGGGAYTQVGTPVGPSYTDTGLTNGTTYSYKIAAVDAAGNTSAQSAAGSAAPGDTTPPSTPTINAVTKNNSAHTITITWTAATDNVAVVRYKVYRNGTAVTGAQPTGLSYVESNLSSGAAYAYEVSAVDAAGNESAKSPIVSTYVS